MSAGFRALPRCLRLTAVATLLAASSALAQVPVPVPRDTLAPDTLAAPDTTATPAVLFPAFTSVGAASFAAGEWVWDRDALLREAPVSLVELLETIPGVSGFRAGMFVQPEAASAFGVAAGRVEIVVDGVVLDPLSAATLDLSQLPLSHLRQVRVERRLGLLRIRLLTDQPTADQPYTRIEAGVGIPTTNLFRALFLVPHAVIGPLSLGIERVDTDGTGRDEPADVFTGWGKWSWTNGRRGVQLEWLRTTLRREPNSPWPLERVRQDFVVRARQQLGTSWVGEVYAGRTSLEETVPVEEDTLTLDREAVQAGVRVGYSASFGAVNGTVRYRNAELLPRTEAVLEADAGYGPLRAGGELALASWHGDAGSTSYGSARLAVGPFLRTSAFAEFTTGTRAAPLWNDSATIASERTGWRAGLTMALSRAYGSIAYISLEQDRAMPFGLPFDSAADPGFTQPARGIEAHGRMQLIPNWLAIESWIIDWQELPGWTYMPTRFWRTTLELHALPLPSGNLEILARGVATQRSSMLAFEPEPTPDSPFRVVSSYLTFSGYLQIRIIDVRAFIRWDDALGADIESLPDRIHNGPRILYGVKWNLWN